MEQDDVDREHYIESEVRNDKLVTYSFYITWDILPEKRMKFPQNY